MRKYLGELDLTSTLKNPVVGPVERRDFYRLRWEFIRSIWEIMGETGALEEKKE